MIRLLSRHLSFKDTRSIVMPDGTGSGRKDRCTDHRSGRCDLGLGSERWELVQAKDSSRPE